MVPPQGEKLMETWEETTKIFRVKSFELKEEHIKLLQRAYVGWDDREYGAPKINPKRPFGNSGRNTILLEMAKILGLETFKDMDGEDNITEEQAAYLEDLWWKTDVALQIILRTRSFQPGVYEWPQHHMRMIRLSATTTGSEE